ncbi:hypothetical protein [Paenibacillus sp. JCM 10914]|uniref:hypothetical protein n=1 Tax=Paenibacillus sp. JCM 10914 TaxID=1236974 RepID=UPI0003CC2868|nr:hypothetical protein [Paenibacillus sp. JCM 10914]GAE07779.1 hypothetical protein JCM10914_4024 [Paenibacillus sp. JCM 10914]
MLPTEVYRHLATTNIMGMLYYFIQDDIMDSPHNNPSTFNKKHYLTLANLLYYEFITSYQIYFRPDSCFWNYFRTYNDEWAEGVMHESNRDYFQNDPTSIAKKAAPVKLGSTGALLLSGKPELIAPTNEMMTQVLITLQMMDDWTDWEQDLADGSYNCLLSLIKSEQGKSQDASLTVAEVQQALYTNNVLKPYAQIAARNHSILSAIDLDAVSLISFHQSLVDELIEDANYIEFNRQKLLYGGLNYYLSNQDTKR